MRMHERVYAWHVPLCTDAVTCNHRCHQLARKPKPLTKQSNSRTPGAAPFSFNLTNNLTNSRNFARGLQTLRACTVCIHACVARIETHTYVFFLLHCRCCSICTSSANFSFLNKSPTRVANRHPARVANKK